ncbi:hypothetical protein DFA_07935 [Cavenderia fasciculata]|uniref:Uncharacterized protein n=1 Tax=Cavenderia fasciculata TaxID=261658 RepID=F4Q440_CACFS|nr:uncharacterized protein DFA_07935 [Cavenderia fasciculata]EGG16954.1 hypothetical protein DFA_07935 [Cavenderia fasciculata]|eukprot:XP_004355428.1 hypothetical protein DFA_07935 [Cavenderia fasciculata]
MCTMLRPGISVTKLILPTHFDWNRLDARVKKNLRVISLNPNKETGLYPVLKQEDFAQLEHIQISHRYLLKDSKQRQLFIPESVWKFTILSAVSSHHPYDFAKIPQIRMLRVLGYVNHYDLSGKNYGDVIESQVTWFREIGYQYIGSTFKNNNNNNNNSIIDNNKYSNFIIRKIIRMVWYARDRCTCVYDQDYLDRLEEHNPKLVYDQELIEQYHFVKNQCALHASTNKPFKLLYHTMVESNRSRLQLTLISKDLFEHVASNFFNDTTSYPTQKSQFNVFKTIRSITCFDSDQQLEFNIMVKRCG